MPTLEEIGLTKKQSHEYQQLAAPPAPEPCDCISCRYVVFLALVRAGEASKARALAETFPPLVRRRLAPLFPSVFAAAA